VLDAATGLPIRIEIVMRSDEGDELVQLHYSDWRPVAGVLYPFAERCSANGTDAITVYDAIEAGVALPEEHFALPDAIRKLQEQEKPQERSGDAQAGPQPSTQIVVNEEQPAASIRIKIKPDQANRKLAELLPEVMACLTEVGASAAGPPFARFHGEQDGEVDFEAGVPVAAPIAPRGRVKPSTLPGGRSAMAWYSGPYSGLKEARARLAKSLVDLKLVARGGAWVSYWTDTSLQRDRKQCRSQLFQPVE
jgi:effector-binding domain-containing protein